MISNEDTQNLSTQRHLNQDSSSVVSAALVGKEIRDKSDERVKSCCRLVQ
jgi:hypothetical protein